MSSDPFVRGTYVDLTSLEPWIGALLAYAVINPAHVAQFVGEQPNPS